MSVDLVPQQRDLSSHNRWRQKLTTTTTKSDNPQLVKMQRTSDHVNANLLLLHPEAQGALQMTGWKDCQSQRTMKSPVRFYLLEMTGMNSQQHGCRHKTWIRDTLTGKEEISWGPNPNKERQAVKESWDEERIVSPTGYPISNGQPWNHMLQLIWYGLSRLYLRI